MGLGFLAGMIHQYLDGATIEVNHQPGHAGMIERDAKRGEKPIQNRPGDVF